MFTQNLQVCNYISDRRRIILEQQLIQPHTTKPVQQKTKSQCHLSLFGKINVWSIHVLYGGPRMYHQLQHVVKLFYVNNTIENKGKAKILRPAQ